MALRADCPHCGQWIVLADEAVNRRARCLRCSATFRVTLGPSGCTDECPPQTSPVELPPDEDQILDVLLSEPGIGGPEIADEQLESLHRELGQLRLAEAVPVTADATNSSVDWSPPLEPGDAKDRLTQYVQQLTAQRDALLHQLGAEGHQRILPERFSPLQASIKTSEVQIRHTHAHLAELQDLAETNNRLEQRAEALADIQHLRRRLDRLQQRLDENYRRLGKTLLDHSQLPGLPSMLYRRLREIQQRIVLLTSPPGKR
jgi:hypothetical protein